MLSVPEMIFHKIDDISIPLPHNSLNIAESFDLEMWFHIYKKQLNQNIRIFRL